MRAAVHVETKVCRRCNTEHPAGDFNFCANTRDRLHSWCKPCQSEARHASYLANREKQLRNAREWELAYPERRRVISKRSYHNNRAASYARHRAWVENNRERNRELGRDWYRNNTAVAKAKAMAGHARRKGATGTATASQIAARVAMFGGKCWLCRATADTIDHVIPIARGGTNWPANLRPACKSCNCAKQDRIMHLGN